MTQQELKELLETSGMQAAYFQWKQPPDPPYLVYLFAGNADLVADNANYHDINDWQIELYSETKDPESEEAIETVLKGAQLPYSKSETYVEAEDLYQVLYMIRTI